MRMHVCVCVCVTDAGMTEGMIAQIDTNCDGFITIDEFMVFQRRQAE